MKLRTMWTLSAAVAATVGSMNVMSGDVGQYFRNNDSWSVSTWMAVHVDGGGSKTLDHINPGRGTPPGHAATDGSSVKPKTENFNIGGAAFDGSDVGEGWDYHSH